MVITQIQIEPVLNQGKANELLRDYSRLYPKRKIIGVSMVPCDFPGGWFMTITYEVEI